MHARSMPASVMRARNLRPFHIVATNDACCLALLLSKHVLVRAGFGIDFGVLSLTSLNTSCMIACQLADCGRLSLQACSSCC